ncbi:hypothetical protein [Paludisphaera rhizosphaerae]|uniref:hypothetical protein n=1 Tax=Paludisphaera rhizosphaerae TaxID=2711216 RepID=UPI0013EB23AB|nr:hypothetical protein [Paludisphaera rhizosphaerae]
MSRNAYTKVLILLGTLWGGAAGSNMHQVAAQEAEVAPAVGDFSSLAGDLSSTPAFIDPRMQQPSNSPAGTTATYGPRVEMGFFDTIAESLLGDAYAQGSWHPLRLGTFFSEGWLEP